VTKRFGDFVALDDVTVQVPGCSLTALLGPSGGRKSTLLAGASSGRSTASTTTGSAPTTSSSRESTREAIQKLWCGFGRPATRPPA
jgi:sulfate transport system ATP-binding protein